MSALLCLGLIAFGASIGFGLALWVVHLAGPRR